MLGFERLRTELMNLPPNIDAQAALDRLVEVALRFTNADDLHDDITIFTVRLVDGLG